MTANLIARSIINQSWPSIPRQGKFCTGIHPALAWFPNVVSSAEQLLSQSQGPLRHPGSLFTGANLDLFKQIRYCDYL